MHIFHILIYFTYKIYKNPTVHTHARAHTHNCENFLKNFKKNVKHINGYLPAYDTNPEDGDLRVGMREEGSRRPQIVHLHRVSSSVWAVHHTHRNTQHLCGVVANTLAACSC